MIDNIYGQVQFIDMKIKFMYLIWCQKSNNLQRKNINFQNCAANFLIMSQIGIWTEFPNI